MRILRRDCTYISRFTDDRIIPRFHIEGVSAGQQVYVFKLDAATGERFDLLATEIVEWTWPE